MKTAGATRRTLAAGTRIGVRLADLVCAAAALLTTSRRAPPVRPGRPGAGPVVLVLPVLPDLSHTFVYREVLALLRRRPQWRVFVLEHDPAAPVHAAAREVLEHARFVPRDGVLRRMLRVLGSLLRRPGRELFSLYRTGPQGSVFALLGKEPHRDPRHPGNAFALAAQLRGLDVRHVHVYGSTYAANVALGAALLLDVPFSISSYVDFEFDYAHKLLAAKFARARFFRVVTAHCATRLRALLDVPAGDDRIVTLLLGLDLANWNSGRTPAGTGLLVSAARLVEKKGLQFVPAALATLRERGVPCRWRVLGDGPLRATLQQACAAAGVAELVEFAGAVDNEAVARALHTADVALLPCVLAADGERDGIPIFLCEAMALGVPVVTTAVSGIPELVRDGATGFLCAPQDASSLAATLERVLRDPAAAAAVGARGKELVHRELDVDRLAAQLAARIER